VSTLTELLAEHTRCSGDAVEHLQRVVAEWQLLADMSFADFLLWVPLTLSEVPTPLDRARAKVIASRREGRGGLAAVLLGLDRVELDGRPTRRVALPEEHIVIA